MAPQVTILPNVLQTNTLVKNVAEPTCSNTMSQSAPPVASRIALPKRLISSRIGSPASSLSRNSRRSITACAPSWRQRSVLSSLETTAIAFAP